MNSRSTSLEQLLHGARILYQAEKDIEQILVRLCDDSRDDCLNQVVTMEAYQNRTHRYRLEAFIASLEQVAASKQYQRSILSDLTTMYRRLAGHHQRSGYEAATRMAVNQGQFELAGQLRRVCQCPHPASGLREIDMVLHA